MTAGIINNGYLLAVVFVNYFGEVVTSRYIRCVPPAMPSVLPHAFRLHADLETLLEPAVWAALPEGLADVARAVSRALVLLLFLERPPEELGHNSIQS